MPRSEICEIPKGFGAWREIGVEDALALKGRVRPMRCPECHGEVRPHTASEDGMAAHFEHLQAHEGCSLGAKFGGVKSMHPHAIKLSIKRWKFAPGVDFQTSARARRCGKS